MVRGTIVYSSLKRWVVKLRCCVVINIIVILFVWLFDFVWRLDLLCTTWSNDVVYTLISKYLSETF